MVLRDTERRPSLFADPQGDAAQAFFAVPNDAKERASVLAAFIWSQACTGKFVWPVPDRGLKHRIHRIAAPTLLVWGEGDRIVPPVYADEFAQRIAGARVELIANAGHLAHLEQSEGVAKAVLDFVG
jgi:pimeloyl-ACP methyl ester carboxylesterase